MTGPSLLTAHIAGQIEHAHADISDPGDWRVTAAVLIVSSGLVRDGLTALDQRDAVLALHAPHRWDARSPTVECRGGCGSWPCETVRLLGGAG